MDLRAKLAIVAQARRELLATDVELASYAYWSAVTRTPLALACCSTASTSAERPWLGLPVHLMWLMCTGTEAAEPIASASSMASSTLLPSLRMWLA